MSLGLLLLIFPFILQAGATFFDEFYFHHKRGLPLWERLGHPLDTLTVLACFSFVLFFEPTKSNILIYIGLALFSCLFITKDEFIHHEKSLASEQWLHSVLFVIHPITLFVLSLYWFESVTTNLLFSGEHQLFQSIIKGQFIITIIFLIYQILYWSIPWKKLFQAKHQSTTTTTTISEKIG
ncbi:MAG: hypothetical protein ACJAT2_002519 [Bacteriovoracaceae bacterium]|jgi:hypothetical protein